MVSRIYWVIDIHATINNDSAQEMSYIARPNSNCQINNVLWKVTMHKINVVFLQENKLQWEEWRCTKGTDWTRGKQAEIMLVDKEEIILFNF